MAQRNKKSATATGAVGLFFPTRDSLIRLVGAVLAKHSDESADGGNYMGLSYSPSLTFACLPLTPVTSPP
jgi:putative transposase